MTTIKPDILEKLFKDFVLFIKTKGEDFKSFKSSNYLEKEENYKYAINDLAKERLDQKFWKEADIESGKVQENVKNAIKAKLDYKGDWHNNNLVDWRKRDDFAKLPASKSLGRTLFYFYKNKTTDSQVFEELLNLKLSYQLIAYLYFIKDRNQYLPISQTRFDEIFELLGISNSEFKTSGNASWDNYKQFIDIIKQVKDFLRAKVPNVTLLDAHSFLFILGTQMKEDGFYDNSILEKRLPLEIHTNPVSEFEEKITDTVENLHEEVSPRFEDRLAEELSEQSIEHLTEGAKKAIIINAYERNARARELCIKHWKAVCSVCDFDFEEKYGEIGKGFIHVHHLKPLWQIEESYQVDPVNDLRPVCPNCHAMLHRQEPGITLTIDKLKLIIEDNRMALSKKR